jgi:hypothetical protein
VRVCRNILEPTMSQQVNFFADPEDAARLNAFLLSKLSNWLLIATDRGVKSSFSPQPITFLEREELPRKVLLLPFQESENLYFSPRSEKEGEFVIQPSLNPVLEYSPCKVLSDGRILHTGRFYWAFERKNSAVMAVMRWVRSKTVPVSDYSAFRIFPSASKSADYLQFWAMDPIRNPLKDGLHEVDVSCFASSTLLDYTQA